MKKFVFKLETLLAIKAAREKEIQNELAALVSIQNAERMRQDEYRAKIAREQESFNAKLRSGRFAYADAMMYERFVEFAGKVIVAAQGKIEAMEPEIQKVRDRLVQASTERRVIEKLKERQWKAHRYQVEVELAKENDDANQKVHLRRKIEMEREIRS
ncbi:MAG TPA: hypothetical protein PLE73_11815 [Spirochaetota bacterium]|nr:hypothetical protein [Spirochaetota bacterium]HPI23880.1 hypothetical protein [Spirochaetota bacterium]HPU88492.1 hypothetical protein [Spirochaetota bacterium]